MLREALALSVYLVMLHVGTLAPEASIQGRYFV